MDRKRVHIDNQNAADILQRFILSLMGSLDYSYERDLIILLCRYRPFLIGDSFGPITGTLLEKRYLFLAPGHRQCP